MTSCCCHWFSAHASIGNVHTSGSQSLARGKRWKQMKGFHNCLNPSVTLQSSRPLAPPTQLRPNFGFGSSPDFHTWCCNCDYLWQNISHLHLLFMVWTCDLCRPHLLLCQHKISSHAFQLRLQACYVLPAIRFFLLFSSIIHIFGNSS